MAYVDPARAPDFLLPLLDRLSTVDPAELRIFPVPEQDGFRHSAVLMLFADGPSGPDVLLTERASALRKHSGQVAFPGGATDPGDCSPTDTALREAREEVGVDAREVTVHAELPDLFIPVTGFVVTPVLASAPGDYTLGEPDPGEVAQALRIPLHELIDPGVRRTVQSPRGRLGPAFVLDGMFVWGFTAHLLDRVLNLGGFDREWDHENLIDLPGRFYR